MSTPAWRSDLAPTPATSTERVRGAEVEALSSAKSVQRFEVNLRGMELRRLGLEPPRDYATALAIWSRYHDQVQLHRSASA